MNGLRTAEIHLPNWVTKSVFLSDCYFIFANSWITQKLFNRFAQNQQDEFRTLKWIRWSGCLKFFLTPSWGDKRIKQPKYAQNFKGWLRFLTITSKRSYGFSQFWHCSCFQSRGIHCWHFYWATMFAWSQKIQVNFRFERYWWVCLMNFWNFHTIHVV